MSLFPIRRPPAKEAVVSEQPHDGDFELSARMTSDLVLHEGDHGDEVERHAVSIPSHHITFDSFSRRGLTPLV